MEVIPDDFHLPLLARSRRRPRWDRSGIGRDPPGDFSSVALSKSPFRSKLYHRTKSSKYLCSRPWLGPWRGLAWTPSTLACARRPLAKISYSTPVFFFLGPPDGPPPLYGELRQARPPAPLRFSRSAGPVPAPSRSGPGVNPAPVPYRPPKHSQWGPPPLLERPAPSTAAVLAIRSGGRCPPGSPHGRLIVAGSRAHARMIDVNPCGLPRLHVIRHHRILPIWKGMGRARE